MEDTSNNHGKANMFKAKQKTQRTTPWPRKRLVKKGKRKQWLVQKGKEEQRKRRKRKDDKETTAMRQNERQEKRKNSNKEKVEKHAIPVMQNQKTHGQMEHKCRHHIRKDKSRDKRHERSTESNLLNRKETKRKQRGNK